MILAGFELRFFLKNKLSVTGTGSLIKVLSVAIDCKYKRIIKIEVTTSVIISPLQDLNQRAILQIAFFPLVHQSISLPFHQYPSSTSRFHPLYYNKPSCQFSLFELSWPLSKKLICSPNSHPRSTRDTDIKTTEIYLDRFDRETKRELASRLLAFK